MDITKKLEAEIIQVMDTYWSSYLNGDLETWASFLPDNYRNIGTTQEEIWNSKNEIVDYTHKVIDQMVGMAEMRNKETQVISIEPYIMAHELGDVYVKMETGWSFYAKIRLSTLLDKTDDGWKVLHQHGSYPDSKTAEGETFAFDTLKAENAKLQEAVKNRTVELKSKNKELEIEASLEKVRSASLAMQNSNEIREIVKVVFEKLKELKFAIDGGAFVATISKNSDSLDFWIGDDHAEYPSCFNFPNYDAPTITDVWNAYKSGVEFISKTYSFTEKNIWFEYAFNHTDLKTALPEDFKKWILEQEYLTQSFAIQKNSMIGLHFHHKRELSENEIDILKRFSRVFEQSYTRFLDLQKAEAQAREAQIEASLERLRSRTMAMHKSDELRETVGTLLEQLVQLDFDIQQCSLSLINHEKKEVESFQSTGILSVLPTSFRVSFPDDPRFYKMIEDGLFKQEGYTVTTYAGEEKRLFDEYVISNSPLQFAPKEVVEFMRAKEKIILCRAHMKYGLVEVVSTDKPVSNEKAAILQRFAKVFEQTYTRFLDLQKAEAQAREAQIEAALEKVRSRSLAMHTPNELGEVVSVIVEKLKDLDVVLDANGVVLCTYFKDSRDVLHWIVSPDFSFTGSYLLPYFDHPIFSEAWDSKESGAEYFSKAFSKEEKDSFFEYAFEHSDYRHFPDDFKKWVFQNDKHILSFAWQKNSAILIPSHTGVVPSENDVEILKRFARVFEQAYVRFLDLQKAEAQAREAQIESALERVRSRTMAMHHTSELQDVINTVHQQFKALDIAISGGVFIAINEENKQELNCWGAGGTADYVEKVHIHLLNRPIYTGFIKAINHGPGNYSEEFSYKEKMELFNHLFKHPPYTEAPPERKKEIMSRQGGYTRSCAVSKNTTIFIINHHGRKFSEEENQVLIRFGKVFEQTYTRFLDLKKAEEQAREAQIEAALERVRSRSMGMHQSNELLDTAKILFQQLQELGIGLHACGFSIPDKDSPVGKQYLSFDGTLFPEPIPIRFDVDPYLMKAYEYWKKGKTQLIFDIQGEELKNHLARNVEQVKNLGSADILANHTAKYSKGEAQQPQRLVVHHAFFRHGILFLTNDSPIDNIEILVRFAKVFEQTYTRFLDLQKAEAQAREAEIQLALERVRARTMAMHKSEELRDVIQVIFEQLIQLNFDIGNAGFLMDYRESDDYNIWMTDIFQDYPAKQFIPQFDHVCNRDFLEHRDKGPELFTRIYSFDEKNSFIEGVSKHMPTMTEEVKKMLLNAPALTLSRVFMKNIGLYLFKYDGTLYSDAENATLIRFGKAFEQTYIRFKDLEKAEAQAREAEIELALERVRARTMAMHESIELADTARVMIEQMKLLGINTFAIAIGIFQTEKQTYEMWISPAGELIDQRFQFPYEKDVNLNAIHQAWLNQEESLAQAMTGDRMLNHLQFLVTHGFPAHEFIEMFKVGKIKKHHVDSIFFKHGALDAVSPFENLNMENKSILIRFAKVFEQTYTRFLDLQKAEVQAREAQIEAALERVRSRTMAMQHSDELIEVVISIFNALKQLDYNPHDCTIFTFDLNEKAMNCWSSIPAENGFSTFQYVIPIIDHPFIDQIISSFKKKQNILNYHLAGEEKESYDDLFFQSVNFPEMEVALRAIKELNSSFIFMSRGAIATFTEISLSEKDFKLLERFSKVVDLSYSRFLDLKKAEAQAREAEIEIALERIRSKTMAMQSSKELAEVSALIFDQLKGLGGPLISCGVVLCDREPTEQWMSAPVGEMLPSLHIPKDLDIHLANLFKAWENQEELYVDLLDENELSNHNRALRTIPEVNAIFEAFPEAVENLPPFQFNYAAPFKQGYILVITSLQYLEDYILPRFAKVFEQTYTRFLDLQKAEAQAREAIKQASLDRVRGEIASMRTTEDLDRITPLIWKELNALGVPFIRCGVFIIDDENQNIHTFLSTPTGASIAAFHLPYDTPGNFAEIVSHWRVKQNYIHHWGETEFLNLAEVLLQNGSILNREQYLSSMPKEGIHLNFLPFLQGMLYVGNIAPLNHEDLLLVQSLASTFSTAYARYEDFNNLESAKEKIEHTLIELKSTQSQLIQAEKMASLGQLTAGIAHEIQNPLNFVNNFSEVSNELLDEMKEELLAGNLQLATEIANDVIQNLEKINHHGKRADAIVKGMLQHSQTSKGQKEPTDINALADEYLRLSYHGLRAKDKSFNANFKMEFDESLPKINVIPQDIGRVLLNLINNAFYAVKAPPPPEGGIQESYADYKPMVIVKTSYLPPSGGMRGACLVSVSDNGSGIPSSIQDKIFQPFFTTKPTGQGTGLGLSLSYDIIKAHGGELKVESNEGKGTEFIIQLNNL